MVNVFCVVEKLPNFLNKSGYIVDIDECTATTDDCDTSLASCTNTVGSYTCICTTGYEGDGTNGGTGCSGELPQAACQFHY